MELRPHNLCFYVVIPNMGRIALGIEYYTVFKMPDQEYINIKT